MFPVPVYSPDGKTVFLSENLARDVLAHAEFEPDLRLLFPRAETPEQYADVVLTERPGLSFRLLPWNGRMNSLPLAAPKLYRILKEEAKRAEVWHSTCSIYLFDATHIAWHAGQSSDAIQILIMDSDPAMMIEKSGGAKWKADYVRRRYLNWVGKADIAVINGEGVWPIYAPVAKIPLKTPAIWLDPKDFAPEDQLRAKFAERGTIRMTLPSRLLAWKGIDDTIMALRDVGDSIPDWTLDIIGEGDQLDHLKALAAGEPRIRFLGLMPYGAPFFEALRSYHILIAPTRSSEETRIVFDAAASGCVIVQSDTPTLSSALQDVRTWKFQPGNVASLGQALVAAASARNEWEAVAIGGQDAMRGKDISVMHRLRHDALARIRAKRKARA
jgi:glycosyltransferase involved in cell wall biosynthesis